MAHTETLIGAGHTREELLRVDRVVFLLGLLLKTVVTIAAILLYIRLAEIGQQDAAAANVAFAISHHLLQLLQRHKLLLLARLLPDKIFNFEAVAITEKDDALRGQPIASGTPRLLVVAFEVARQVIVNHSPYIRLANTHAEGDGCHQYRHVVSNEAQLILRALFAAHTRVIGQGVNTFALQCTTDFVNALAALTIDNDGRIGLPQQQVNQLLIRTLIFGAHFIGKIGAIKTADIDMWFAQFQLQQNIIAHSFCRRRRQGHHWHLWVAFAQPAQLAIFRSKIMAPFTHAVRLVHRHQRYAHR